MTPRRSSTAVGGAGASTRHRPTRDPTDPRRRNWPRGRCPPRTASATCLKSCPRPTRLPASSTAPTAMLITSSIGCTGGTRRTRRRGRPGSPRTIAQNRRRGRRSGAIHAPCVLGCGIVHGLQRRSGPGRPRCWAAREQHHHSALRRVSGHIALSPCRPALNSVPLRPPEHCVACTPALAHSPRLLTCLPPPPLSFHVRFAATATTLATATCGQR